MERINSDAETRSEDGEVQSRMHMRVGEDSGEPEMDENEPPFANATEQGDTGAFHAAGDRAADLAGRAGRRIQDGVQRAGSTLEARTGIVAGIRRNPVAAVGIAFSAGLLAAVATGGRERHPALERVRTQLRGLLLSGLTATVVQELKSLAGGDESISELFQSLFDDD